MRKGFTLIELVVVVLIMGILASIGLPYYYKTIEASKAGDAVAIGHLLANSYRMYMVDNPGATLSGQMTNDCNSYTNCSSAPSTACKLVACNYVSRQDWGMSAYNFYVGVSGMAAQARRNGGTGDYAAWGYDFTFGGGCARVPESPTGPPICPRF